MKKKQPRNKKRKASGKSKTARKATSPIKRKRSAVAKARRAKKPARRKVGSIREAAAQVLKSGALLVGHTGQRVIAEAASLAKAKVHDALESAAQATSSQPQPGTDKESKS
jgi:hypothetical protein